MKDHNPIATCTILRREFSRLHQIAAMVVFVTICCLASTLVVTNGARAEQVVKVTPYPTWATSSDIPKPLGNRDDEIKNGRYLLLWSVQTRFADETRHVNVRYAEKVTNRQGLEEAGYVSVPYRPGFDQVALHKAVLHRAGKRIDILPSLKFQHFRRETDLEKGIIDGRKTAYASLERVRVGDVVEVSYTISYSSILMPDHFFIRSSLTFSRPVELLERRYILPTHLKPRIRHDQMLERPAIRRLGEETSYTWTAWDPDPVKKEGEAPSWFEPGGYFEISTVGSWADVARDSVPHYPQTVLLPVTFKKQLNAIKRRHRSASARIAAVLALIQNDVRYVGVEIGRGAFIPRSPGLVLQRGYGDCKDKSYLMVSALRSMGIKAVPALAHLGAGKSLGVSLPSPYAFDHVIVRAEADGRVFFLDPTNTQQHSPDPTQSQANLGYVLAVSENTTGLDRIEPVIPHVPQISIFEKLRPSYHAEDPAVTLSVRTLYRGPEADRFRRALANNGRAHYEDRYLNYYSGLYGDLEAVHRLTISDNKASNVLRVDEKYRSKSSVKRDEIFKEFQLKGDAVHQVLEEISSGRRTSPIAVSHPQYRHHRVQVDNLPGPVTPLDGFTLENDYFRTGMVSRVWGKSLSVEWTYRTRASEIPGKDAEIYRQTRDKIQDQVSWYYDVRRENLAPETNENMSPKEMLACILLSVCPR